MIATITRQFQVDYGHRLQGHEGKCKHVHGHRGVFEFTFDAPQLDKLGRVVDFGVVKELIGTWLDTNWDHAFIAGDKDVEVIDWLHSMGMCCYVLPAPPTIENLVLHLCDVWGKKLDEKPLVGFSLVKVKGWETPNCSAEAYYRAAEW